MCVVNMEMMARGISPLHVVSADFHIDRKYAKDGHRTTEVAASTPLNRNWPKEAWGDCDATLA